MTRFTLSRLGTAPKSVLPECWGEFVLLLLDRKTGPSRGESGRHRPKLVELAGQLAESDLHLAKVARHWPTLFENWARLAKHV